MATFGTAIFGIDVFGEIVAAGSGGGITLSVALWRATIGNAFVEDLSDDLDDGKIEMNLDRAIKMSSQFALRHPEKVTPYRDYLAPIVTLEYDDGSATVSHQVGLFAVRTPPRVLSVNKTTAQFDGEDLTSVLATSVYTDTDNVPAGTGVLAEIISTLAEAGITRFNFPPSSRTTDAALSFPVGTTRLAKCNALTTYIGWYDVYAETDGRIASQPIRSIDQVEPFKVVDDDELLADVELPPAAGDVANVILVILDDPSRAPLTAIRRNDDPSSPTSTVVLDREIYRQERRSDLATQTDVDALADRLLAESRSYYQPAKVVIRPDPTIGVHQTVDLDLEDDQEALDGRWWIRTWEMGLAPATLALKLDINRTTDTLVGVTI